MNKKLILCAGLLMNVISQQSLAEKPTAEEHVIEKVLDNGMTVLVKVVRTIPKVSVQMWYNVGSKDEKMGQKGLAHLIEHMIFKGTKEKLSESDISAIVYKLSGNCNAGTNYDYTTYTFDMPTHHWKKVLPIIADCMQNAAFKDEHLNSEMKAVIQELKMINDQHFRCLAYKLLTLMFEEHPYHYPLIGYKKDLFDVRGADLREFYKKHYLPNNATFVVVGDVDPQEVFDLAEKYFGKIPADKNYKKEKFHLAKDIASKSLSIYRDVQLPVAVCSFLIPGSTQKVDYLMDVLALALANGKSSRLHKKLVDDLQLVTSIGAFSWQQFEYGAFLIYFEPKKVEDIDRIESIIFDEIQDIAQKGLTTEELERSTKQVQMSHYAKLENIEQQASDIGEYFLATGDKEYAFNYMNVSPDQVQLGVKKLLTDFFRPTVVHRASVLPLPENEKANWKKLQRESDALDHEILSARVRTTEPEEPKYAKTVKVEEPGAFDFPKAKIDTLSNDVKLFYYHNDNTPKINLILSFKAKDHYDPQDKQGLYNFVMEMLDQGTKNYSAQELADAIETRGMSFYAAPGIITMSMLSEDLEKGLEILEEILSRPSFDKKEMKKVREQILANIKSFWDSPMQFSGQLIKEQLYAGHPYSKNILGTQESVKSITQKDLKTFHKNYISPDGARLAIVGDLSGYDLPAVLEKKFTRWSGPQVEDIEFPELADMKKENVDYYINRDQVVLCFAGLSVSRIDKDYEKFLLFDQIFSGSMNARLYKLREESGLFYGIFGSLCSQATEEPGMALVRTRVSLDRLKEAEQKIQQVIDVAADDITKEEFQEARLAVENSLMNNFEKNSSIARSFLFLDRYGLPADYFDILGAKLTTVTIPEMQAAVKKVLNSKKMVVVRIGRVEKEKEEA